MIFRKYKIIVLQGTISMCKFFLDNCVVLIRSIGIESLIKYRLLLD